MQNKPCVSGDRPASV